MELMASHAPWGQAVGPDSQRKGYIGGPENHSRAPWSRRVECGGRGKHLPSVVPLLGICISEGLGNRITR